MEQAQTTMKDVRKARRSLVGAALNRAPAGAIDALVDTYTRVLADYLRDTLDDKPGANLLQAIADKDK